MTIFPFPNHSEPDLFSWITLPRILLKRRETHKEDGIRKLEFLEDADLMDVWHSG